MNEDEVQLKRRDNEEQATAGRARILRLPYLDTRGFEKEIPLIPDLLTIERCIRIILFLCKGVEVRNTINIW